VPAQKRLWRHDQAASAAMGKHPGEGGGERAIGGPKTWTRLLPTQHHQLMPQNQQLDVLGELAAPPSYEQPQQRREREIDEGEDHLPILPDPRPRVGAGNSDRHEQRFGLVERSV